MEWEGWYVQIEVTNYVCNYRRGKLCHNKKNKSGDCLKEKCPIKIKKR